MLAYNMTKGRAEKICSRYQTALVTRRLSLVLSFSLIITAGINAKILLLANNYPK
jgi:hypothetical protein